MKVKLVLIAITAFTVMLFSSAIVLKMIVTL